MNLLYLGKYLAFTVLIGCFQCAQAWTESEQRILESLSLNQLSKIEDPSNRYLNNPQAQALGKALFFDKSLSANGQISCASCHQAERYFTDGKSRALGIERLNRHTPTVVGSAYETWLYWDGRRDSLWSQALVPFESASEMGSSRLAVSRRVLTRYQQAYIELFGRYPVEILDKTLPEHAGPLGDQEARNQWHLLSASLKSQINTVYANIGKVIAAYEATLVHKPSRFDHYVNGKADLTADELAGLTLFIDPNKTQCLQCHNGPRLTNLSFHNIGTGNFKGENLDFGRLLGLQSVLTDPFNCLGPYSDAKPEQCLHLNYINKGQHVPLKGAFKVPSLRNVSNTAPYFHDGRFQSLAEVIAHYNMPPKSPESELKPMNLSAKERQQLEAFLGTLSSESLY